MRLLLVSASCAIAAENLEICSGASNLPRNLLRLCPSRIRSGAETPKNIQSIELPQAAICVLRNASFWDRYTRHPRSALAVCAD